MKVKNRTSTLAKRHRYNWIPDLPDHRDFQFIERMGVPGQIPTQVDLRAHCPPVANQGQIGSCTGNAVAGLVEYMELADIKGGRSNEPEVFSKIQYSNVSRLFIYYNERELSGTTSTDSGSTLRNGMKSIAKWGVCRERVWGYSSSHVLEKPALTAYEEAAQHRIGSYLRIATLDAGLRALASGLPFVFGFTVFESFESPQVAKTGVVPLPTDGDRPLGGHAVMAVGYDQAQQWLIVRNSWGAEWGDHGYFYLPFAYANNLRLAQDFWTIRN